MLALFIVQQRQNVAGTLGIVGVLGRLLQIPYDVQTLGSRNDHRQRC
jgi:hypothetical protein